MTAFFTRARHPDLDVVVVLPVDGVASCRGWEPFGETSADPVELQAAVVAEHDAAEAAAQAAATPAKSRRASATTPATPEPTPAATGADDTNKEQ